MSSPGSWDGTGSITDGVLTSPNMIDDMVEAYRLNLDEHVLDA